MSVEFAMDFKPNNVNDKNNNINSSDKGLDQQHIEVPENKQTKTEKTINYYKFLLQSVKIEMKVLEFFYLMKSSSSSEIGLWILSACILATIPDNVVINSKEYVWFHLLHLLRGIIGIILIYRLPKTYDFIDCLEGDIQNSNEKTYNEILREVGNREIMPKIEANKWFLIIYLIATIINLIIDIIDFISSLGNIDPAITDNNYIFITLAYLVIALIYISKYML
jgi:hypothetical protein